MQLFSSISISSIINYWFLSSYFSLKCVHFKCFVPIRVDHSRESLFCLFACKSLLNFILFFLAYFRDFRLRVVGCVANVLSLVLYLVSRVSRSACHSKASTFSNSDTFWIYPLLANNRHIFFGLFSKTLYFLEDWFGMFFWFRTFWSNWINDAFVRNYLS